jgi:hypothetical protein
VGFAPLARLAPTPPSPRLAIPSMAADDQWDLDRLRSSISANQNARFGAAEALLSNPKDAWVLLFNEGRHDEGVLPYTSDRVHTHRAHPHTPIVDSAGDSELRMITNDGWFPTGEGQMERASSDGQASPRTRAHACLSR